MLGFRAERLHPRAVQGLFLPRQSAPPRLALIETGQNGMHHMMVELFSLDDVGQGYDIAQAEPDASRVDARAPHQRPCDVVLLAVAVGLHGRIWLGRPRDRPATWQPRRCTDGPSLWGHDRAWLRRTSAPQARAIRMEAAPPACAQPVQVMEGNYQPMPGVCPWWDASKG